MLTRKTVCSAVAVLLLSAVAGASTLDISIQATPLAGNEYRIDVFGTATGTDTRVTPGDNTGYGGLYFTAITLTTPGSVGKAEPKEKFPPPNSKKTVMTYGPRVVAGAFTQLPAVIKDFDADGDMDSVGGGFTDVGNWPDTTIAADGPALLLSQTWIVHEQGVVIEAIVDPLSRYYDLVAPQFASSFTTEFDDLGGDSVTIGMVDEVTAAAGGPYSEQDWPEKPDGWNTPSRTIVLDGTGSTGPIDSFEWFIAPPVTGDYVPLASGPTPEVSIQAIADALGISVDQLPGPYDTAPPDPSIYNYRLMLTVAGGGSSDSDETTLFVPEPATIVLLGLGGLGALLRRRRA